MARTLNPAAHAVRRDAFVDAGQQLIQGKGFEQMSIQDVLDALDASRGAFYHYFDSKEALLDAVIERMVDGATASLRPVVADPDMTATRKLQALFAGLATWKAERTELILAVIRVWLSDGNAIVREKFRRRVTLRLSPLLADIVRQGSAQGEFVTGPPDGVARVLVWLVLGANELATELFIARQAATISLDDVERALAIYPNAMERILGASPGSFAADPELLRKWFA